MRSSSSQETWSRSGSATGPSLREGPARGGPFPSTRSLDRAVLLSTTVFREELDLGRLRVGPDEHGVRDLQDLVHRQHRARRVLPDRLRTRGLVDADGAEGVALVHDVAADPADVVRHLGVADTTRALRRLAQQRLELALASSQRLAAATIPGLPPALRARVRDDLAAHEELARLTRPQPRSAFKTGPARPANELLADFRRAELRFGVPWNVLAAVNLVESGFGRLRNDSVSGAQGPMQFLPATWHAYGLGGDVHDPAGAILGAANYLHANGAPRNTWNALYRYNPSRLYVDAVLRFAREIR